MLIFLGTTAELFFIRAEEFIFTSKIIFSRAGKSAKTLGLARNSVNSVQAFTFKLRLFIDIGKPKHVNCERYFNINNRQKFDRFKGILWYLRAHKSRLVSSTRGHNIQFEQFYSAPAQAPHHSELCIVSRHQHPR